MKYYALKSTKRFEFTAIHKDPAEHKEMVERVFWSWNGCQDKNDGLTRDERRAKFDAMWRPITITIEGQTL